MEVCRDGDLRMKVLALMSVKRTLYTLQARTGFGFITLTEFCILIYFTPLHLISFYFIPFHSTPVHFILFSQPSFLSHFALCNLIRLCCDLYSCDYYQNKATCKRLPNCSPLCLSNLN